MTPKNTVSQSLMKVIRYTYQGSTTTSTASGGVMTRSMAQVVATIVIGQLVVIVPSQSRQI